MGNNRDILCDSSSFISLTESCLDRIYYFLHEKYGVRFIIPTGVEEEMINTPLSSRRKTHALSALKIKKMINDGVITKIETDKTVEEQTRKVLHTTNNLFFVRGKPLTLVHYGEAEMIALASYLDIPGILIDERTTRLLIEAPFTVKNHFEKEFNVHVMMNKKNLTEFSDMTSKMYAIRSSELVILAYEHGYFDDFGKIKRDIIEAALRKTKFSGCSIRFDEIDEYLSSLK